jgi:trk system potassium uptake protein TrkH
MAERYGAFLRERYRVILAYTGLIALVAAAVILSPLLLLIAYPQEIGQAWGLLLPGLALGLPGLIAWRRLTPREAVSLTMAEGAVIVIFTWLLAIAAGAVPFVLSGRLSLTQALFESTSGWTTTGSTVLDVDHASHLLLFYRSATQLAGGAGLAILMLSALAGPVGPGLSIAEGRSEQLLPHVRRSARLVLSLYSGYVVLGIVALRLAGMSWFDAVNQAFTALSTGGFATHSTSVSYWHSPAVEAVLMVLMLLGALNFLTVYTLLKHKLQAAVHNSEVRQMALFLLAGGVILFLAVSGGSGASLAERLRAAAFNTVSALSTTGFGTVEYGWWNGLGWLTLILLMLVGGSTGSAAGGIKQYRIYVLYRGLVWEVRRRLLPASAVTEPDVWKGETREFISDEHLRQVALFAFLYLAAFFAGSGLIAAYGYPLANSLFEMAGSLGAVGVSAGITTAQAPAGVLWVGMAAMVLGRLEFFTVFVGLGRLAGDVPVLLHSRGGVSSLPKSS